MLEQICIAVMMLVSLFFLTVPFLALWDLIAFIIFIVNRKKSPEKRKKAEDNFVTSSIALTLATAVPAALYAVLAAIYSL